MSSTRTAFSGDWLVSEYVYTPAGEFAGIVRQRRQLHQHGDLIRVVQFCEPIEVAAGLTAGHPLIDAMNRRVGGFVFDLEIAGRARRYHGPDVIGGGFSWHEGVLTARGIWPGFGYNFTSFSMLINPNRQVTGGKFFIANSELCTIVGLATPESEGYPEFGGPQRLEETAHWSGSEARIAPDGSLIDEQTAQYEVFFPSTLAGRAQQYGWMQEIEAVNAPGETVSWLQVLDNDSHTLARLRRWFRDEKLERVDVALLTPEAVPA